MNATGPSSAPKRPEGISPRIIKRTPFCWQSKVVRRAIRKHFDATNNVTTALSLYDALTEVASDDQAETFTTTHAWLRLFSGVGISTIKKHLAEFVAMGILGLQKHPGPRGPDTYTLLPIANGCLSLAKEKAAPLAPSEEPQKNREECVGAEPLQPAHTQLPPWFAEVAANHPTVDAKRCLPDYLRWCKDKRRSPCREGFSRWLGDETKHLVRAAHTKPKPTLAIGDGPAGWKDTQKYRDSVFAIADGQLFEDRWGKLSAEWREAIMAELATKAKLVGQPAPRSNLRKASWA